MLKKGFTLLELLLVIAIISVLAGLVIFNLRPADVLQNTQTSVKAINATDIKKAIEAYILDHGGSLPSSLQGQASGEYTICRQAEESCPVGSISLDELITGGYLSAIPVDENTAGEKTTGFVIDYNADTFALEVSTEVVATPTPDIVTGLMGWWKMDEASWGTVNDSSGNGYNGTSVNGASITNGKYGNAGNFDGSNDYLNMGNININNSSYTVSAWTNRSSNNTEDFIFANGLTASTNATLHFGFAASYVLCGMFNNDLIYTNIPPVGVWQHWICTFDVDTLKHSMYLDGQLVASRTATAPLNSNSVTYIGRQGHWTQYFHGKIDDVRLYNRALSDLDVLSLYNWGPGPVAHWKFDEGSGGTVADSSGNNLTATINTGTWVQGKYGNAISLNGSSSSYVYKGSYTPPYSQGSYMLWIKPNDQGGTLWDSNGYLWLNNGTNQVNWYGRNSSPILGGSLPLGEWKHVAVTWGPSLRQIYVDGVLVNSDTNIGSNIPSSFVYIGKTFANYSFYNGIIDDIRLYNYARMQGQIVNDMNNL